MVAEAQPRAEWELCSVEGEPMGPLRLWGVETGCLGLV